MYKPTIFIVDDEPLNLKLSAECLSQYYVIHLARSGQDAVTYLEQNRVDIILLDIMMPEMDGFETADKIRNIPLNAQTPIIYLTADNSVETIEKAFDSGAIDYILKPFRKKELLVRVKNRIETEKLKITLYSAMERNEHLLDIVNHHVAFIKTDTGGNITEASSCFCDIFHVTKNKLIGQNMNIFKSGRTPSYVYELLWKTITSGQTHIHEIEDRNFAGETNWFEVTISSDISKDNCMLGYIAFYTNIDEKIQYQHDAHTDHLTGLNNRSKFEKEIKKEIYRAERYKKDFSIIMVDIDHFKDVNDNFGHEVGDSVLKEFAVLLAQNIRHSDMISRWGGEEFIILCPNTDSQSAAVLAEKLRDKAEEFIFKVIGHKTASFGVAQFSKENDAKKLFLEVDQALYEAKKQGRNRVISWNK